MVAARGEPGALEQLVEPGGVGLLARDRQRQHDVLLGVSIGSRLKNWNTNPMCSRRSSVSSASSSVVISVPAIVTVPVVGLSRPARMCISVDLPGAGRAHHGEQVAAVDRHRHAAQGLDRGGSLAVAAGHVPRLDDRRPTHLADAGGRSLQSPRRLRTRPAFTCPLRSRAHSGRYITRSRGPVCRYVAIGNMPRVSSSLASSITRLTGPSSHMTRILPTTSLEPPLQVQQDRQPGGIDELRLIQVEDDVPGLGAHQLADLRDQLRRGQQVELTLNGYGDDPAARCSRWRTAPALLA